jgi:hypothetical protein
MATPSPLCISAGHVTATGPVQDRRGAPTARVFADASRALGSRPW